MRSLLPCVLVHAFARARGFAITRALRCALASARPVPLARALRGAVLAASLAVAHAAVAATASYSIALDTDSNAATGCVVATANGPLAGIEQVVTTVVTTSTTGASVTRLERAVCSGGAMESPSTYDAGGWPVGLGNGTGSTGAIETSVPLSMLPAGATMRATALSTGGGGQDATATFVVGLVDPNAGPLPSVTPVPLSPWLVPPLALGMFLLALWMRRRYPQATGLAVLLFVFAASGLVWAATVIRDGQVGDWAGMSAVVTDPRGDAPADADMVAVFFQQDGSNLYFRVDADVRTEVGNRAPVVSAGSNLTVTLPAQAMLQGSATDDGLPNPPGALTLVWTKISGPGTVTFGNMSAAVSSASFSAPGTYVLRLTANDGALATSADVTVTVNDVAPPGNGAPQIAALPDRTVIAGNRMQAVAQASDPDGDVLTYSLSAAPSGTTLNPAPLIDWVPTAAQAGVHTITVAVSDGHGHSASTSFNVTVTVPSNTAPVLGGQPDQMVAVGATFTRTLSGTDADAGDTLTYALVSGPAGMTLTGNVLTWATAARASGDYNVTVRVTDSNGAYDQKSFVVTLQMSAPPHAIDDSYTVRPGATLTVNAPGVLANDVDPAGGSLVAQKLTDPARGTLSSFGANGAFTYVAPSTVTPSPSLAVTALPGGLVNDSTGYSWAADINHDGGADVVTTSFGTPMATDGKTGARLWTGWDTSETSLGRYCLMYLFGTDFALGDVDGSGDVTMIQGTNCDATYSAGASTRLIAVDANPAHNVGGAARVKWVSERLDAKLLAAPTVGASPVPVYPLDSQGGGLASAAVPTLARLTPGGAVKVLIRTLIGPNMYPYDRDGDGTRETYAGCGVATGKEADVGKTCTVTLIVDAATGVKEAVLTAPNPRNQYQTQSWTPFRQNAVVVADLDGDGQVEIISGGDVYKYVSGQWTLAWQAPEIPGAINWFEPDTVSVADLDGDGKAEVIMQSQWDIDYSGRRYGFLIYSAEGTLLRSFAVPTGQMSLVTIADVDGDGAPEFVFSGHGIVYAYRPDGTMLWASMMPDDDGTQPGDLPGVQYWPWTVSDRTRESNGVQVYDLQLDGSKEVIANGNFRIAIIDGKTGVVKRSVHHGGYFANKGVPLIVDADGDGHAEIFSAAAGAGVCPLCASVNTVPFAGVNRDWAPAPLVHNQANYNPWAITDNGTILYDGGVHRSFRNQRQMGTVVDPRTTDTATFTYTATGAGGTSAPAKVSIQVAPQNSPPVITSVPPTSLLSQADALGHYPTFLYQITATDPDVGDTIHYELVYSSINTYYFPQATVDPVTGVVNVYTGPCGSYGGPCEMGQLTFIVAAIDSFGARAEQSFFVDLTYFTVTVPDVVGQLVEPAKSALLGARLTPRVVEVFSAKPSGTVVAQDPVGGSVVTRSSTVLLSVSKGPQPVTMPFVVGKQLVRASMMLSDLGLATSVTPVTSSTVPAGEVIAQSPAFGTVLDPTSAPPAQLTVSTGGPLAAAIASIVLTPGPGPLARLVGDTIAFTATAVLTDGTSADISPTAVWSSTSTSAATVDVAGGVRAKAPGSTVIAATQGGKTAQVTVNVSSVAPGDHTPPVAIIASPADGTTVTGPVDVTGTASDASFLRYELAYAPAGEDSFTLLSEGTSPVTSGVLGRFDPTVLANDLYTLRLTVFDKGQNETVVESTVQVAGQRKVGVFTLAFTDLSVSMAGLPIDVVRTYDSRDKTVGDFGVGWRLGLNTLRLRTNRVLGTGWERVVSGPGSALNPKAWHTASITLPDGHVEQFDMRLSPTSGVGLITSTRVTGFVPRAGAQGTLEVLGNTDLLIVSAGSEDVLVDDGTFEVYDPRRFRYTSRQGTRYEIDRVDGATSVQDRNGNTLTIGRDGIVHSSGTRVSFVRDVRGRIVQVVDPNGNTQAYAYDGNGNLAAHVNAVGGSSTYRYDRNHGLIDWHNARGVRATRNDYDASGRLLSITDAAGKTVTFDHADDASVETVTDRRGNVTRLHYDAEGNVTRQERPVTIEGTLVTAVTTATFDALGNQLSQVDADGRSRTATFDGLLPSGRRLDPAGLDLASSISYTTRGAVATAADASGGTYAFGYDTNGALTSATFPGSGTFTFVNDATGEMVSRTDPAGNRTAFTRDAAGRVVREERYDASSTLLRRTDFAFDANGNVTRRTLYRTSLGTTSPLTTTYAYDAANRLVTETDPLGGVRRTEYDAAGRVAAVVDPLGRRTAYTWDDLGQRTRTTFADGTFETTTFDADGNVIATTDRAGRTTTHAYDELRRRVQTTFPGGATTRYVYSAAGQLVATIDPRGNRTDYGYDAAARPVSTTQPAVADGPGGPLVRPVRSTTLDGVGRIRTRTDPAGRVTSYDFDANGQRTKTTYPDGATTLESWDALGRRTQLTDADGKSTTYGYDGLGRLVSVAGAAGTATYTYDEAGNRVTRTDALGRVTRLVYDALDRLVERRYPGGGVERFTYNAAGELVARTSPSGRTTTLAYDATGNLVRKVLPDGATIDTAYAADGQRTAVTDSRGTTAWGYDAAGRLSSIVNPDASTLTYTYDPNGNLLTLAAPGGTVSYAWDALDRLEQMNAPEGATSYARDVVGNLVRRTAPNGVVTDVVIDVRDRPASITHSLGATTLQSFAIAYSPAGRRTSIGESGGAQTKYDYDALGRLVAETRTGTSAYTVTHAYDAVGNRTQSSRNGAATAFTYDADDRLLQAGSISYAWTADGDLASRTDASAVTQFDFDGEHRLIAVTGGGQDVQYQYDADGHRVRITDPAGVTRLLVDTMNPSGYAQVIEERDASDTLRARQSFDRRLAMTSRGGGSRHVLTDPFGSVRALVDDAGAITDRYLDDAYGIAMETVGTTANPYRYRGERVDVTGLYDLRARAYDPAAGRFLSRDPFAGDPEAPVSMHRYLYANGDPVNHVDPTGTMSLPEVSVVTQIMAGLAVSRATATFLGGIFQEQGFTLSAMNAGQQLLGDLVILGASEFVIARVLGPLAANWALPTFGRLAGRLGSALGIVGSAEATAGAAAAARSILPFYQRLQGALLKKLAGQTVSATAEADIRILTAQVKALSGPVKAALKKLVTSWRAAAPGSEITSEILVDETLRITEVSAWEAFCDLVLAAL